MLDVIHPDTALGAVYLTVSNLSSSLQFYSDKLGFQIRHREARTARLGAGEADLLVLTELPGARSVQGTTGLYHFAVLVPSRRELAQLLKRVVMHRLRVRAFADHVVSEAIYLSDPDGNGIAIYRDRPRVQWPPLDALIWLSGRPLDVKGLMSELHKTSRQWTSLHPRTTIGCIHLRVADVDKAEAFYHGVLGFDIMADCGPTTGLVAAGGYHHHIAYNTWFGVGLPPAPPDAVGLRWFDVCLSTPVELDRVATRIWMAGLPLEERDAGLLVRDPSQIGVMLTVKAEQDSY